MTGILGKKVGMTRIQEADGKMIPITVIECAPNTVTQVKTVEKDGYAALVIGFDDTVKTKKTRPFRHMREFRINTEEAASFNKGDQVTLESMKDVALVSIHGVSKGKGFQGVMKRYNFRGGPRSHGSHFHREPGSVGCRAKPGKIAKGRKLPGHMGLDHITLNSVKVAYLNPEHNLIGIKGAVPGAIGSVIIITKKA
jgi:large subunit ribosomal protein L3